MKESSISIVPHIFSSRSKLIHSQLNSIQQKNNSTRARISEWANLSTKWILVNKNEILPMKKTCLTLQWTQLSHVPHQLNPIPNNRSIKYEFWLTKGYRSNNNYKYEIIWLSCWVIMTFFNLFLILLSQLILLRVWDLLMAYGGLHSPWVLLSWMLVILGFVDSCCPGTLFWPSIKSVSPPILLETLSLIGFPFT